jgi:hypothetical protein
MSCFARRSAISDSPWPPESSHTITPPAATSINEFGPKRDERDGRRGDASTDGTRELEEVPRVAAPGEQAGSAFELRWRVYDRCHVQTLSGRSSCSGLGVPYRIPVS